MRKTAGVVCAIITIIIYGIAIISGIVFTDSYTKLHLNFDSDFYYTWFGIVATAAVLSAIHHGLWSIIDNQIAIYDKLGKLETQMYDLQNDAKMSNQTVFAEPALSDANSSEGRSKIPSSLLGQGDKKCPFCGAWMNESQSRCSQCGKFCE